MGSKKRPDVVISRDPAKALAFVKKLRDQGALFAVSHSGGKDSMAMMALVRKLVPREQIIVVHADLSDVVWKDTTKAARQSAAGLPFREVKVSFFDMVKKRGMWPSAKFRQCTSDLKRTPINRVIREYAEKHGFRIVVSALGLRAEEGERKHKPALLLDGKLGGGPRQFVEAWYIWLPVHQMPLEGRGGVWDTLKRSGQKRHYAYDVGAGRCSCPFCIMANKKDLRVAAEHNPLLLEKYATLERKIGHTIFTRQRKGKVVPVPIKEHIFGPDVPATSLVRKPKRKPPKGLRSDTDMLTALETPRNVQADDLVPPGVKARKPKPRPRPRPKPKPKPARRDLTIDEIIDAALAKLK
jgi:3'-phosphoadenosine 5'-phosphosulfate sulfotransferase (PAPS reductase)/FAD synthetase